MSARSFRCELIFPARERSLARSISAARERSLARSILVAAVLVGACGKKAPSKPEADPKEVKTLAYKMIRNVPTMAAYPDCTPADLTGGATMTFRTLMEIGGAKLSETPEEAAWINPHALDTPAARTLADPKSQKTATRQAAAELLAAPFWVAYKVDHVNAPMALGVKELKIGTVHTRVIRYEKTGVPKCALVWAFQNDQLVSDDAIARSDKANIDPAIAQLLKDDLVVQYVKQAPNGTK